MLARLLTLVAVLCVLSPSITSWATDDARGFRSHPPLRPLAEPSASPLTGGPTFFVDPAAGNDGHAGTQAAPWKTLGHAFRRLRPGDTLCLRSGAYFEHVTLDATGTAEKPVTIRSFPNEVAILDGGISEFQTSPLTAWEPFAEGGPGEYRSARAYPELVQPDRYRHEVALLGNFTDSLIPLHGYRFLIDFRAANEYWTVDNKPSAKTGVYCGPGVWLDPESKRIHVRLSHTHRKVLGSDNYRGETDPRHVPLVVAGYGTPLRLAGTKHVRLQDLVVRGSAGHTVEIDGCEDVRLDGLTIYGGAPALQVHGSAQLRISHCALRGLSTPWSSRASHKYRGISSYLAIFSGESPACRDVDIEFSEFTDNHDGLILGTIHGLRFHHNVVENFDDDGLYLTLSRSEPPRDLRIYQNYLARSHTLFSFAESGMGVRNEIGDGVFIFRNVLDFRRRTPSSPPVSAEEDAAGSASDRHGRPSSDHGSPVWDPMFVYHNTMISHEGAPGYAGSYGMGIASHTRGTRRRVFNNIFVQTVGLPGIQLPATDDDLHVDGNLHWGTGEGPNHEADFFAAFRRSKAFEQSRTRHKDGWGAHDLFADPRFVRFSAHDRTPIDLRLRPESPAIDAGVEIPSDWPDPLREEDRGRPDLGAIPAGTKPWHVGVRGRFSPLLEGR